MPELEPSNLVANSGVQELFVKKKHLGNDQWLDAVLKAIGKHRPCRLQWKGAWQVSRSPVAQVAVEKLGSRHVLALHSPKPLMPETF